MGLLMTMRHFLTSLALVAALAPAAAHAQFSDSYTFLKAVRDADGAKVTQMVQKPGSGAVILNTRDNSTGEAALHIVAKRRDTVWLNFILAKGANPDIRDGNGATPLMLATQLGWTDGMSLLIERRAQVDLADGSGETPLIRAVRSRNLAAVRMLLTAGANPDRADTASGLSARQQAERDPRAGTILTVIKEAKPKPKAQFGPN
ncbi:MAG: ankyrin repeat domain-containing protein [Sphingomonadaceae bacterium]